MRGEERNVADSGRPKLEHAGKTLGGSSLRSSLLISYIALVLALSMTLSWVIGNRMAELLTDRARERIAAQALVLAQRLDDSLAERLVDIRTLAMSPLLRTGSSDLDPALWREMLAQLMRDIPDYAWIGRADVEGRIQIASGGLLEGQSVASRPWFQRALDGPVLGDAHEAEMLASQLPAPESGEPLRFIDIAAPVLDLEGRRIGVVGAHLSLAWAGRLQDGIRRMAAQFGNAEVLIANRAGEVLIGHPAVQGRPMWEVMGESEYLVGIAATAGSVGADSLGWTVLVRLPRAEALRDVSEVRWTIAAVALVVGLMALAIASIMARLISDPLRRLAREARQIIAGESREFGVVRGYRESAELSAALHTLMESLGQRQQQLERLASGLERQVAERTEALASANQRLAQLAITDPLTGLYNRRHFDEQLSAAAARCSDGQGEVALLLVDIDHFKKINDRHGHPAGDEVLRQVSALLGDAVRPSDLVARIGGEEFAVIAVDTPKADAQRLGERLLQQVRSAAPLSVGRLRIPLSVSLGLAHVPRGQAGDAATLGQRLLSRADAALYDAKRSGRDQMCVERDGNGLTDPP